MGGDIEHSKWGRISTASEMCFVGKSRMNETPKITFPYQFDFHKEEEREGGGEMKKTFLFAMNFPWN